MLFRKQKPFEGMPSIKMLQTFVCNINRGKFSCPIDAWGIPRLLFQRSSLLQRRFPSRARDKFLPAQLAVVCRLLPVTSYPLVVGSWQLTVSCLPAIKTHCQSIDLYEIGAHVWFANSCHLVIIKSTSVAAVAQTCLWLLFCGMHHFPGNLILILFADHLAKRFLFIFMHLFVFCLRQNNAIFQVFVQSGVGN